MTAIEISTADTAVNEKRAKIAADLAAVAAARTADERLTTGQLVTRCGWVVAKLRGVDPDTAADVAADLLAYVGERFGWQPRGSEVCGEWLTRWAVAILRKYTDERLVSMDTADTAADTADTAEPFAGTLLEAERRAGLDHVTPAADPDAADLAAALELSAPETAALTAALSGWGSAIVAADGWQCSHAAARKRMERGRDALRERYPRAADLAAAVAAACVLTPDPANPERADLPPAARAAARAVEHASGWLPEMKGHAAPLPDAWRGYDVPCRVVRHRQDVPAPAKRNPQTRSLGNAGRVPCPLRGSAPAADVLRYMDRMAAALAS